MDKSVMETWRFILCRKYTLHNDIVVKYFKTLIMEVEKMKKEILIGIGMMCGTIITCFAMYSAMLVKLMKPTNNLIKKSEKLFDIYVKDIEDDFDN